MKKTKRKLTSREAYLEWCKTYYIVRGFTPEWACDTSEAKAWEAAVRWARKNQKRGTKGEL
jgi:hypothetical protein